MIISFTTRESAGFICLSIPFLCPRCCGCPVSCVHAVDVLCLVSMLCPCVLNTVDVLCPCCGCTVSLCPCCGCIVFLHTCGQDVGFILQPTSCPHQGSFLTKTCITCGLPAESGKLGRLHNIMGRQLEWKKTFLGIF